MQEPRRGLGRGLSALLGEVEQARPEGSRETPIDRIHPNPDQPRRSFPEAEIEELAASIRERGVLQPILVRHSAQHPELYEIVAGERRWRAAQRAGLRAMPVLVREMENAEAMEVAIVENVQRADLNPMEEAAAYRALMDAFGRTQEAVARAVGKSRSHVANALRLLNLPPAVRDEIAAGRLSAGHAKIIAGAPDPEALARRVLDEGLNVRATEAIARETGGAKSSRPGGRAKAKSADVREMERQLSDALGLKVEISDRGEKGQVRISYETLEQFEDVLERLTRRQTTA
jgi:ParB family transcriptional regulator, chromosome partitioning protein